jgi:LysM repeat protein
MLRHARPFLLVCALLLAGQASTSTLTVRRGDTLSAISKRVHVPVADLARANGLANPNLIRQGQVLRIPSRGASPFAGLGTWVDVYDFSPEFQVGRRPPAVTPAAVDRMAAAGVRTLFLQAAAATPRVSGLLVDPPLLNAFLTRAHARGLQVVAWYLPPLRSVDTDMQRLAAMRDFRAKGQSFDGIAVDIESTSLHPAARSTALVQLARRLRSATQLPLGAIVMPPVLLEVVNPSFWPGFPWSSLTSSFDAWLPMTYWTLRTPASGYRDAGRYTSESVRRLRARIGPTALIHPIGGLGTTDAASYAAFVRTTRALGVAGRSVYDFASTPASAWSVLRG